MLLTFNFTVLDPSSNRMYLPQCAGHHLHKLGTVAEVCRSRLPANMAYLGLTESAALREVHSKGKCWVKGQARDALDSPEYCRRHRKKWVAGVLGWVEA